MTLKPPNPHQPPALTTRLTAPRQPPKQSDTGLVTTSAQNRCFQSGAMLNSLAPAVGAVTHHEITSLRRRLMVGSASGALNR